MTDTADNTSVYAHGSTSIVMRTASYTAGSTTTLANKPGYLFGNISGLTSKSSFTHGVYSFSSRTSAFLDCTTNAADSTLAYLEGVLMANAYIVLTTSDSSMIKRVPVLVEGYNDGSLQKSQNINKTLGGGIDIAVGGVYRMWNMVVRVRHTETDSNYASLADLEYLYKLNDPGGTPNNILTMTDHLGTNYSVILVGDFQKMILGVQIEGEYAWYNVMLQMMEVL